MIHQAGPFVGGLQLCVRCGVDLSDGINAWDEGSSVDKGKMLTEDEPDCPFDKDAWKAERRYVALLVWPEFLIDMLKRPHHRYPAAGLLKQLPGRFDRVASNALPPDTTFVRAGHDPDGQLRLILTSKEFGPVPLGAMVPNWPTPTIETTVIPWPQDQAKVVWGCCECEWHSDCDAAADLAIQHCNLTGHHTGHLVDMRKMREAHQMHHRRMEARAV